MRTSKELFFSSCFGVFATLISSTALAQDQVVTTAAPGPAVNPSYLANSYIQDRNGDGLIKIAAFGDSITRGVGDFIAPGEEVFRETDVEAGKEAGYPLRIELTAGIGVSNLGEPGERLTSGGLDRFASAIAPGGYDVVVISGGSNDARGNVSRSEYFRSAQIMINIANALGAKPVLISPPPACCGHDYLSANVQIYSSTMRTLAFINNVPLADLNQAFANTCNVGNCKLLNLPEGLHPNIEGYDVMGEMVLSTLLKIDLLAPEGALEYEAALNLIPGSVLTKPTPVTTAQ